MNFSSGVVSSKMTQFVRFGGLKTIHDKESAVWSLELVVGIKVKTEAKMHEDRHDCNYFY